MTAMIQGHETGIMRALSVLAIAAFVALAMTVLPGFAPSVVQAGVPVAMAKADKLPVVGSTCAEQSWPNLSASCLRRADSKPMSNVRLVTADRQ